MNKNIVNLVAGIVIGGLVAAYLISSNWKKSFESDYCLAVIGQVHSASEIKFGRHSELYKSILGQLPAYVKAVDQEFGQSEDGLHALWSVREFYMMHSLAVPADIRDILDNLPPRP